MKTEINDQWIDEKIVHCKVIIDLFDVIIDKLDERIIHGIGGS